MNLFNMGVQSSLSEIRILAGDAVTLIGSIPPRDVLSSGTPAQVEVAVENQLRDIPDRGSVIFSCGGGMPPGVSTGNLNAFVEALCRED